MEFVAILIVVGLVLGIIVTALFSKIKKYGRIIKYISFLGGIIGAVIYYDLAENTSGLNALGPFFMAILCLGFSYASLVTAAVIEIKNMPEKIVGKSKLLIYIVIALASLLPFSMLMRVIEY